MKKMDGLLLKRAHFCSARSQFGIYVTRGCYLCYGAKLNRLPLQTSSGEALISPADRQLVIVQYNTWCTIQLYMPADHLSPCHIHFPRLHSSIQQPQPCSSAAARSLKELSASVTIRQVSYYPSLFSHRDAHLWTKGPPIRPVSISFSPASFMPHFIPSMDLIPLFL